MPLKNRNCATAFKQLSKKTGQKGRMSCFVKTIFLVIVNGVQKLG